MKIRLLLTLASLVWASAPGIAEDYPLAQTNRPMNSGLEQNRQAELPAAWINKPIESPPAQVKKPIESSLARSQRCVGAECGLIPSDIAGHEP
jgi:hypothetical protein